MLLDIDFLPIFFLLKFIGAVCQFYEKFGKNAKEKRK